MLSLSLTEVWAQDCVGPEPGRCSLQDSAQVIFIGTALDTEGRFRVTEAFRGIAGDQVEVHNLWGHKYRAGEQYVVFADFFGKSPEGPYLLQTTCGATSSLEDAGAILEQLRAEKTGKHVAAVYGMLWRALKMSGDMWGDEYPRPMPNVVIRLESGGKSFEARTDALGVYAFDRLPPGKYTVSAKLPPTSCSGS